MIVDNFEQIGEMLNFTGDYDFYIVQIIKRRKDNPDMERGVKTLLEKYVTSLDYYNSRIAEWKKIADENNARVYINPNKRRMDKMAMRCMHKLSKLIMEEQYNSIPVLFQKTVGNYCDEKPKRWIIDLDDHPDLKDVLALKNKILDLQEETKENYTIVDVLETKNGYHIVTNPFNLQKFLKENTDITIHKNSPTLAYCP